MEMDLWSDTIIDLSKQNDTYTSGEYKVLYCRGLGGNDTITGGSYADQIYGNEDNDVLAGEAGDDTIYGGIGSDSLRGQDGNDILRGQDGDDTIHGGVGSDILDGGTGNDIYYVNSVSDKVIEDYSESPLIGNNDTVYSTIEYALPVNVENLVLNGSTDMMGIGNSLSNLITGNTSSNILRGLGNNDTLLGKEGDDLLFGGDGSDYLNGGNGFDQTDGEGGVDIIIASEGNDLFTGGSEDDIFVFELGVTDPEIFGVDTVTDFVPKSDKISLHINTLTQFSAKAGDDFTMMSVTSSANAATSEADIVYNSIDGSLFYNENGVNPGFGTGGLFVKFLGAPAITASDFIINDSSEYSLLPAF